jgi:transposase, IS30 family
MAGQLTLSEREQIAHFRTQGLSAAEIGRRLKRHRGTIGREVKRNSQGSTYWASAAQSQARRRRHRRPRKMDDPQLNEYVRSRLVRCWSPEQIAGRLGRDFRHQPRRRLSHSTIYRWIISSEDRAHWQSFQRFGPRRKGPEKRGKLPARAEIAGRPPVVDERRRFGDWEGDTIVGKDRRGGLFTLLERKSGFALMAKLERLKSHNVARAACRQLKRLPPGLRHTATFDNGKEFAAHQRIERAAQIDIYFARPYHAWERGANESFNGLVRQFFPKGTDFTHISPLEVKYVLNLLNDRPRKRLGYKTPREILAQHFDVALEL